MNVDQGHRLVPKLWETLPSYNWQRFIADLIAGITVGLVALPLAMAFAISSGVKPQFGIYTAIIAGIIVFQEVAMLWIFLGYIFYGILGHWRRMRRARPRCPGL